MLFKEFVNDCIDHILVVDTALVVTGASSVDDPKSDLAYVQSLARGALAFLLGILWPKSSVVWSLCRKSKGLAVDGDGIYYLGLGNVLSNGSFDGSEVNTAPGVDVLVSGDILAVELTWSTPAAPAVTPGPSNPFAAASWEYGNADSADAIRRRRLLAARHSVHLHSYEHVADRIYAQALGIRITFFPTDFGAAATDVVPDGLLHVAMARFLAMYYGQKGGSSGIAASGNYDRQCMEMIQLLMAGKTSTPALVPYGGS